MKSRNTQGERRLMLIIFYEGPWAKLMNFAYGIRKDGSLRFEVPADPKGWRWIAAWLGDFFEARDYAWQDRYAQSGKIPHDRWKRREHEGV